MCSKTKIPKLLFNDQSLCEEYPPLAEVNYTLNDPLKVKQDKTYYIKDDNSNEKYKFIIENVQPFEDLYDDILEIKQSENYVWVLNRGRNRLVKSERLVENKTYKDVFQSLKSERDNSKIITAWGVSVDTHKDYEKCLKIDKRESPMHPTNKKM